LLENNRELKIGCRYKHFKGMEYLVLHMAKHSETLEDMVVYQPQYGDRGIWVRPLTMFMGKTIHEGKEVYRFVEI
jgi:hypothetical protein